MAKLPILPSALDLVQMGQSASDLPYGKHPNITVNVWDRAASIYDGKVVLVGVRVEPDGSPKVIVRNPAALATANLPYVNRFLEGTGKVLVRYFRAKIGTPEAYSLRNGAVGSSVAVPTTTAIVAVPATSKPRRKAKPVAKATTVTAPVVNDDPAPATITVSASPTSAATSGLRGVPGMKFPAKVKVKGAGRGWTQVGTTLLPTDDYETLVSAWTIRQSGGLANVIITGPAGTAKTILVEDFAASLGVPYLKVDGGAIRTADDWSGALRQDGQTKVWSHRWSAFAQVLLTGEPCIVHIDELTRTESPQALNALLGLLDGSGTLLVPDANGVLTMPKGILVISSANIGPEFVGTLPIDGAVRQRFPDGIRMGYPPASIEAGLLVNRFGIDLGVAQGLVRMAASQRKDRDNAEMYPSGGIISTRILLYIAERIALGNRTPRQVITAVLKGQFEPGDDRAVSVCVDTQFPKNGTLPTATATPADDDTTIIADRHYFADYVGAGQCNYAFPTTSAICGRTESDPIHISR